jgi:lipoprotein-anchoring transpeptidase ErfK/SrfK
MNPFLHKLLILLGTAVIALLGSCAPPPPPAKARLVMYDWFDDQGPGEVSMTIYLKHQMADVTRGGRQIGWTYVATGKEGHGTRAGNYRIMEKVVDKFSNRYGWTEDGFGNMINPDAKAGEKVPAGETYVPAPMPYWMRLTSYGIGMHAGIIPQPGEPASHGCIRLPHDFAPLLYDAVKEGTPVTIKP